MTLLRACKPRFPEYDRAWLERYDRLGPADAEITSAEMQAFWLLVSKVVGNSEICKASYLDIGTCTGRYLRWGCDQGFRTICGVDNSAASIVHCTRLRLPGRVYLYCADFISSSTMRALAARHGPFDLVTAMLGTIDHVSRRRRVGFLKLLSDILSPTGTLILSSWRNGRCELSLYSEHERSYLGSTGFAESLEGNHDRLSSHLKLVQAVSTQWHMLAAFTKRQPCVSVDLDV